jgi:GT2 family glycosyltransferase
MTTLCIPTLKRYDLLERCIDSALSGSMVPDKIIIIDNGGSLIKKYKGVDMYCPGENLGVAASWNWFIRVTEGDRIIVNDDIVFYDNTIEKLIEQLHNSDGFAWVCKPYGVLNGFSCFAISDKMIDLVGYFDETISPRYAYFEDNDYVRRMILAGISMDKFDCGASAYHDTSSTLKAFNNKEMQEHHRKFGIAQNNYIKKWGGLPGNEKYKTPYNKE